MPPRPPLSGAAEPAGAPVRPLLGGSIAAVVILVALLTGLRFWAAGAFGLAADEAYYWIWSRHLALGYFDHPPMVAVLIRASTAVFGDGEFGIRWLSVLLGAAASLGVWRLVWRITDDRRLALAGAALVQGTLFLGAGAMLVTPDTPLVLFWTLALLALVEVWRTGQGAWWLAAGLAIGLAFVSKYTAVFLGAGVLIWLVAVPELRRWFLSPWTYAGGALCLAVMAPTLWWNLAAGGASLTKQFGRAVPHAFDPRFVPEFVAGQAALLTPLIGLLVLWGLWVISRDAMRTRAAGPVLLAATTLPLVAYLVWYGLFDRVQGNWTACLLPASIAAAVIGAAHPPAWAPGRLLIAVSTRFGLVVGIVIGLLVVGHAAWRIVPIAVDPTNQLFGWADVAARVERAAAEEGAVAIGVGSYTLNAELRYYGSGRPPVFQLNERARYLMEPEPDVALLRRGPLLVVVENRREAQVLAALRGRFRSVQRAGSVERHWRAPLIAVFGSTYVDTLFLFKVADPVGEGFPDIGTLR